MQWEIPEDLRELYMQTNYDDTGWEAIIHGLIERVGRAESAKRFDACLLCGRPMSAGMELCPYCESGVRDAIEQDDVPLT